MRRVGNVIRVVAMTALCAVAAPAPARAQVHDGWNSERVLALVDRGRALRASAAVDSAFHAYRAEARGYVYFFFDRPDSDERTLVKADQIALEIYWRAPSETRQRIVGLRDQKVLPTNIRYHLDHLTVVQDDFGDQIRLGDGDEVSAVLHPLGPEAADVYDYLLSDSLTLRYGAGEDEVRVYEVLVRPKSEDAPGFIGSVFVDRANAAVVRLSFTFTPSSYVDPYLDYIRISLDNSLWEGRYWLPYRQEVELRREIPQLDFLSGSVIRGRFEIGRYELNPPLPGTFFFGRRVTTVARAEREAFPFERGLFDDLEERGLAPTPSLEQIRTQARQVVTRRALSGLSPLRLHISSVSDIVRYGRAEGLFLGGGVNVRSSPDALIRVAGGYGFGREEPSFAFTVTGEPAGLVPVLSLHWDGLRDIGPLPASSPIIGSLGAATVDEDYRDPYFVRGARLDLRGPRAGEGVRIALRWEEHRSGRLEVAGAFRPVRQVDEGVLGAVDVTLPFPIPEATRAEVTVTGGRLGDRTFARAVGSSTWSLSAEGDPWRTAVTAWAGLASSRAPAQSRFLLGGRGTLPGHELRAFEGRAFWLARAEVSRPIASPWLSVRGFMAVGATSLADRADLPAGWTGLDSDGVRASVGVGVALGWEVLRLDLARGLRDGGWELIFSVEPRFAPFL